VSILVANPRAFSAAVPVRKIIARSSLFDSEADPLSLSLSLGCSLAGSSSILR